MDDFYKNEDNDYIHEAIDVLHYLMHNYDFSYSPISTLAEMCKAIEVSEDGSIQEAFEYLVGLDWLIDDIDMLKDAFDEAGICYYDIDEDDYEKEEEVNTMFAMYNPHDNTYFSDEYGIQLFYLKSDITKYLERFQGQPWKMVEFEVAY